MLTPEDEGVIVRAVAVGMEQALTKLIWYLYVGLAIFAAVYFLEKWFTGQS
jgi:hypothetical protein